MNFLAPAAFWFALTLPVVVVFYLLKRKRVVTLVSSTLLWQKFLAETQASAPFQKLRHNWLLILQLLLLILAILALSRPFFASELPRGALQVVILDASASMQSTDVEPNRFEKAREEALDLVNGMRDREQMIVLVTGGVTEVKQSPTSEKAALRRAIQNATVTDSPTRLVDALMLAETLTRDQPDTEIHLLSDGAAADLAEFENKDFNLVYHKIGARGDNIGIISLDVRPNPEDARTRAIFSNIANYSTNRHTANLELSLDGQMVEVRPLDLAPGETSPQVFIAAQESDGVFSLTLDTPDELAADNEASIVSQLPRPANVLLISKGNRFLEKALKAAANVRLNVTTDLTAGYDEADVVVLDDVTPLDWPIANVLAINTASTNWFGTWSTVDNPMIVDWKSSHPLLRFVGFDNVQIAESMKVTTPSWGLPLVDSQQTPLIVAGELEGQRIIWIGFDLLKSYWPLRISFPIFVANALEWLNPSSVSARMLTLRAGDPLRLTVDTPPESATIELPDGSEQSLLRDEQSRDLMFGATYHRGLYRIRYDTNEVTFAVNVMDTAESDTTPRDELNFSGYTKVAATNVRKANLEIWRWILALGLGVLMFEWWYYHKRTA